MLYICEECSTVYAPAIRCPHCGSSDYYLQGEEDMPKNTVHGGASHELDVPGPEAEAEVEVEEAIDEEAAEAGDPQPEPEAAAPSEPDPEPEAEPEPEPAPEPEAAEDSGAVEPPTTTGRRARR